ncbi:MAG: protein kinase [Rudaea sp.]|uniref:protein kinase domain-containing protein n=1 Tax=Rudaea sp. TaxID=2136325 RepID=UPI0039E48C32
MVTESDTQRWQRIFAVFEEILDAPPGVRDELLARLCAGDEDLRREVVTLIAADDTAPQFEAALDEARRVAATDSTSDRGVGAMHAGDRIGPWRLLRELGAGGMGVVWLAERADGQFEQRVALKLIRTGLDSDAVHRRFLRERQILAHLHHPHIAHLVDGGITANGSPYFAMEYVEGQPLLDYCRGREVGLEGRIRIFLDVCAAVQFAHEHRIVHRDLKPSNVLVTADAGVKLLDFGIAKLLGDGAADDTITHLQREQPMTPLYAAPEQLRGGEATPASDVYALGCVLYELLTGRHSHDFSGAVGRRDVLGAIESDDPCAPSRADPAGAPVPARQLRGNLDMIVLTALRREPERRYASVAALAADLQNHLAGKAVTARREHLSHRAAVFVRRHRAGAAAALAVALTVAVVAVAGLLTRAFAPAQPANAALAIVDFHNLAADKDADWIAPALAEMLATELAHGARMHALPDELVRPARSDLAAPMAGGYAEQSLATLRKRLVVDYVLSGSYLVSGTPGNGRLRFDLALQDARSGAAVANIAQSGALSDLPEMVEKAGARLREQAGYPSLAPNEVSEAVEARPPNTEVARAMGIALEALHKFDLVRAKDELLDVVAMAPGYAPAHLYLAQAWKQLGYDAKALAAAQQAAAYGEGLPPELRMRIAREVAVQKADWAHAIELDRQSLAADPNNAELHLALIDDLTHAGMWSDVDAALAELRALPDSADDPRIDIAAATAAMRRSDPGAQAAFAEAALKQAQARDEGALAATARFRLAQALETQGALDAAEAAFRHLVEENRRLGNARGEANAHVELAILHDKRNQAGAARGEYETALEIYRRIGDERGRALVYYNLMLMLWHVGDRDGAIAAANQSQRIRREIGDLAGEGKVLVWAAGFAMDETADDETLEQFRHALSVNELAGAKSQHVYALKTYSEALRLRGDLAAARSACDQARDEAQALGDRSLRMVADRQCAQIAADSGDLDGAAAGFGSALAVARETSDDKSASAIETELARIDMARGDPAKGRDRLLRAVEKSGSGEFVTGEAIAQSLLALCEAALGEPARRDEAAARARELRSRITARGEVIVVDIALAEVQGLRGEREAAVAALRAAAKDAEKRRWLVHSLEAQLAELRLLERAPVAPGTAELRRRIAAVAQQHGFGGISMRLAAGPP